MDEPAVLRALEGLLDRTGRTLVIVGPPESGKSALLTRLRAGVDAVGGRSVTVRGAYRARSTPFGALENLDRPPSEEEPGETEVEGEVPDDAGIAPMAPIAVPPEALGGSRRRDGRVRTSFFGETSRGRGPPARDVDDYWRQLMPEFQGEDAHPVAVFVEDAAFFDTQSREFVTDLSHRVRLRPLLIAVELDSTSSAAQVWEEAFLGRTDVDWVRLAAPAPDPREVHRLRELLTDLPAPTLRALGHVTLLGGETQAVMLARIARLSVRQLPETLKPAVSLGLLRVREGKVSVPDRASVPVLEGLFPEAERRRWHLEVAEGLQALSSEPPLSRRIEIAHHYLASAADAAAMARLLEAAEISLGLLEYDQAARLLAEAVGCLGSLPPAERPAVEPEMHLLNARALFCAGCPSEGEAELREGVEGALRSGVSAGDLASWLEPLLPALQAVGPRPALSTTIVELTERLHDASLVEPEVLLETLLPAYDADRNQPERSRAEALRAAQNAHRLPERHLQALGLFTMGVARLAGSPQEMLQAGRFLRASRFLLRDTRRWELDYIASEFECRLLEACGDIDAALALRQQSVAALERARLPSVELFHELGIAQILLDRGSVSAADAPLDRARRFADNLHLFPPSPGLLQIWLLDGRRHALAGMTTPASDRWSALVDLPPTLTLPRVRAEAALRLALLEQALGRTEEAERAAGLLAAPDLAGVVSAEWRTWAGELGAHAGESEHGGGRLPRPAPLGKSAEPERRERRRG